MNSAMRSPLRFTIKELSKLVDCEAVGDLSHIIEGVDDLESATSNQATFLENPLYQKQLSSTEAGLIVMHPKIPLVSGKNYLLSKTPSLTFQSLIELFIRPPLSGFSGIHPTAVIHESVSLAEGVIVGPHVVIDQGVFIGRNTFIGSGVFIGAEVKIGEGVTLHPHVVIREGCIVGNRVIIQPGSVIGSCGYGYYTDHKGTHQNLKQLGKVILEDDVEIGANSTIDRARFKTTLIRRGTKIDNLVQIGHQVELGEDNLIVAQVGIAGSTKTGRHVVIGGQSGIAGHLTITDQVILGARSGVTKSIHEKGTYLGAPALPRKEFGEQFVQLRSIHKLTQRITALEEEYKTIKP